MIYFIISHHLPAISCPPWRPLIYFEWTKFLTPIILSHTAFLLSPFRPRPPPPSRGRHRPSSRCTRSRMGSRYVPRFEKPGGGPGEQRRPWLEDFRFSRAGGRSAHQPILKGLHRPFHSNIGKSGRLREDKFYADPKMNIKFGTNDTAVSPLCHVTQNLKGGPNIFFVALAMAAFFPASFLG